MDLIVTGSIAASVGMLFMWRYMLWVCDKEHAIVLQLFRKLQQLEDVCVRKGILDLEERETEPSDWKDED